MYLHCTISLLFHCQLLKLKSLLGFLITTPTQKAALGSQFLQGSQPLLGLGTGSWEGEAHRVPPAPRPHPTPPQASNLRPCFSSCSLFAPGPCALLPMAGAVHLIILNEHEKAQAMLFLSMDLL